MAIQPIVGMLRRQLILDLTVGTSLGVAGACAFWYGYHVPAVRKRDAYYEKLEAERAKRLAAQG